MPLKLKKTPERERAAVFQHEMAIEQDGFHLSEKAVIAVEVSPAGLHHPDARFGKVVDDLHEPLRRRHEVSVEDRDELALGLLQTLIERARLVAVAVRAVQIDDVVAQRTIALHQSVGHLLRLVG